MSTNKTRTLLNAMYLSSFSFQSQKDHVPSPEFLANQRRLREEAEKERVEKNRFSKGLRPFIYGDNTIWSRNQKNADRKAKNSGYIK
jgi:hypothetical protein